MCVCVKITLGYLRLVNVIPGEFVPVRREQCAERLQGTEIAVCDKNSVQNYWSSHSLADSLGNSVYDGNRAVSLPYFDWCGLRFRDRYPLGDKIRFCFPYSPMAIPENRGIQKMEIQFFP